MRIAVVCIYDKSFANSTTAEPSKENAPEISMEILALFRKRLTSYDYELTKETNGHSEYSYTASKSWSLKVDVSPNEIAFTSPLTKSFNSSLVFECLQTASEICDQADLAVYHSKEKAWVN